MIFSDVKTSIPARYRCHPSLAPGQARAMRVNHEYGRGGALAYLVAYDLGHAQVFGRREASTGIIPFMALAMTTEPDTSTTRAFWIVYNGSPTVGTRPSIAWPQHSRTRS